MNRRAVVVLVALLVVSSASSALARRSWYPSPARIEKVYSVGEPFGSFRVAYEDAKEPSLLVESDAFKVSVPREALTDLPAPRWDRFTAVFSLHPPDSGYTSTACIEVEILPPERDAGTRTWVVFCFAADGTFKREIHGLVHEPGGSTRSGWYEWRIGAGISAEEALQAVSPAGERKTW